MKKLPPDAPCARCKSARRSMGRAYCPKCESEMARKTQIRIANERKAIKADNYDRLVGWCRLNNIKALAKQLAR